MSFTFTSAICGCLTNKIINIYSFFQRLLIINFFNSSVFYLSNNANDSTYFTLRTISNPNQIKMRCMKCNFRCSLAQAQPPVSYKRAELQPTTNYKPPNYTITTTTTKLSTIQNSGLCKIKYHFFEFILKFLEEF